VDRYFLNAIFTNLYTPVTLMLISCRYSSNVAKTNPTTGSCYRVNLFFLVHLIF
jgi:hypothetical protein